MILILSNIRWLYRELGNARSATLSLFCLKQRTDVLNSTCFVYRYYLNKYLGCKDWDDFMDKEKHGVLLSKDEMSCYSIHLIK